jgi:peptidoglycan/LPS O-acetylase OafA/YrhL
MLLVLTAHASDLMWPEAHDWMAKGAHLGLHTFFVLSGFLITVLLLAEKNRRGSISLARFARRRILRVLPVLVVFMAVLVLISLTGSRLDPAHTLATAFYSLTFTINLVMVHGDLPLLGGLVPSGDMVVDARHTWSLAFEVHFYLLWGATIWWIVRRRAWSYGQVAAAAGVGIVVVALVRAWMYGVGGRPEVAIFFDTLPRLDAPLVGSLAAVAYIAGWSARLPARVLAGAGGLCAATLLVLSFTLHGLHPALPYGLFTVLGVAAAAVVLDLVHHPDGRLARILAWRPLCWFGLASYSLYIWHVSVFLALHRRGEGLPVGLRVLIASALAVFVGWLSYRFIEQPFLRRKERSAPASPDDKPPVAQPSAA